MANLIYMFWLIISSLVIAGLISLIGTSFEVQTEELYRWLLAAPVFGLIAAIPLKKVCDFSSDRLRIATGE